MTEIFELKSTQLSLKNIFQRIQMDKYLRILKPILKQL